MRLGWKHSPALWSYPPRTSPIVAAYCGRIIFENRSAVYSPALVMDSSLWRLNHTMWRFVYSAKWFEAILNYNKPYIGMSVSLGCLEIGIGYYFRFLFTKAKRIFLPLCFWSFLFTFSIKVFRSVRGLSAIITWFLHFLHAGKYIYTLSYIWASKQLHRGQMPKVIQRSVDRQR